MFINESPIQCLIEYCAGSEQRTNSVGGMVHYIRTQQRRQVNIEIFIKQWYTLQSELLHRIWCGYF